MSSLVSRTAFINSNQIVPRHIALRPTVIALTEIFGSAIIAARADIRGLVNKGNLLSESEVWEISHRHLVDAVTFQSFATKINVEAEVMKELS